MTDTRMIECHDDDNNTLEMSSKEAMKMCETTSDIDTIITLTRHSNPDVRRRALKEICPCRVKSDVDEFWNRVFEMLNDSDKDVRYQVLHTICDGSPAHLESRIADALDSFNRDPDQKIRRSAHKALTSYRKTGKWNIL